MNMDLTKTEEKVLRRIEETRVTTKLELKEILGKSGGLDIVEAITKSLSEKNLITTINPLGSTCFIITRKGNQVLKDLSL